MKNAYAKLDWAEYHIDRLREYIKAFVESDDPKAYDVRRERHNERIERRLIPKNRLERRGLLPSHLVGTVEEVHGGVVADISVMEIAFHLDPITPHPATEIGIRVGDVVNCLRCALDYLVWELSVKNRNVQPPQILPWVPPWNQWRRIQFPIAEDATGYKKILDGGALRLIDQALLPRFQDLQPYDGGKNPRDEWIWALNELWNSDKHRTVQTSLLGAGAADHVYISPRRIISHQTVESQTFRALSTNTELVRLEISALRVIGEENFDPAMDVNCEAAADIAFDAGTAVGEKFALSYVRHWLVSPFGFRFTLTSPSESVLAVDACQRVADSEHSTSGQELTPQPSNQQP